MARTYLELAVVAFVTYSLVAPLLKHAMQTIPSTPAVFLSNAVLLVIVGGAIVYRGDYARTHFTTRTVAYTIALGVLLTIGLLSYYRALELGPVSVVTPIYGLFIVVSSVIGIVILDETYSARSLAGIVFSVLAIVLISL